MAFLGGLLASEAMKPMEKNQATHKLGHHGGDAPGGGGAIDTSGLGDLIAQHEEQKRRRLQLEQAHMARAPLVAGEPDQPPEAPMGASQPPWMDFMGSGR